MGWEIERDADGVPCSLGWVRDDSEAIAAERVRRMNITRRRIAPAMEQCARDRGYLKPEDIGNPEAVMTREEWEAEGARRFGEDRMRWAFVCPVCGHVATVQEYKDAGATQGAVAFSCVGRWAGAKRQAFGGEGAGEDRPGPCDYAGGGLFPMNPLEVDGGRYFNFADEPENPCACCGVRPKTSCGHLVEIGNPLDGVDYDCDGPVDDNQDCGDCPLTNCATCKEARVNA